MEVSDILYGSCEHSVNREWCVECLRNYLVGVTKARDLLLKGMESQSELMDGLKQENRRLAAAIKTHRSQKADDRCIEDDDRLYEALGDGIKCDRRVGSKVEMLINCQRFINQRCEGGGPWKSYVELENENTQLKAELELAESKLNNEGTDDDKT